MISIFRARLDAIHISALKSSSFVTEVADIYYLYMYDFEFMSTKYHIGSRAQQSRLLVDPAVLCHNVS